MKIHFTGSSDPGLVRSNNQDAYYIDPEGRFFIVADGMGGHAGGEEASRIAASQISDYILQHWQDSSKSCQDLLMEAFVQANEGILQDQQSHPERSDMGTTAVVVLFPPGQQQPWCAHVGDSRLYRLRDSHLEQITEDHTWIARAIKFGELNPEDARQHPFRHVLSRCLGREDLYQIDVQPLDAKIGDRLLLCSDGLTEELVDETITKHLQDQHDLDKIAHNLIEEAKKEGGHDNITVVLVAIDSAA